jgi:aldose 1-epimerase
MSVSSKVFGQCSDGQIVNSFTIYQSDGCFCTLLTYGATLQRLLMPDRAGRFQDIVLGYDNIAGYENQSNSYHGATIGRCCNRIAGASFEIDGKTCLLAANDGRNHLHGGIRGFDKVVWRGEALNLPEGPAVNFYYHSPDGQEGYPGNLDAQVTYILTADHRLIIRHSAIADQKTVINLTNHSYFNLTGQGSGSILNHQLQIEADAVTAIDDELIPTGEFTPVAGTALDFRHMKPIGRDIRDLAPQMAVGQGFDHNFILRGGKPGLKHGATVYDPKFGRVMDVLTTLPGLQFYSGNFMKPDNGKEGVRYDRRDGLCLETQFFPDAVHHANFLSPIFAAGEPFRHETVFKFSTR